MKKKNVIIAVVLVIVLLIVTAGIVVWRVFFPDLFKSKQDVFWDKAENSIGLSSVKFTDYSKLLDEYKELYNKSYKLDLNMSLDLDLSSSELDSDTQDLINNSTLKTEAYYDADSKDMQEKIGLYKGKSEVLTLDLVTNKDKFGIKCADLSDKYYVANLEDLIDYMVKNSSSASSYSKQQISSMTDVLQNNYSNLHNMDGYKLLYISEDDLKHLDDNYRDIFQKLIPKDCYSTEKNVEVKIDGNKVTTTGYYLTLTGKDGYNFIKDLANTIKDDDVISNILTEKANIILESTGEDKVKSNDVSKAIEKALDELVESLEGLEDYDDEAFQIAVYSDKSASRIDLNYLEDVDKPDKKETLLTIENVFSKNSDKEKAGKLTLSASKVTVATINYEIVDKEDESKLALSIDIPESDFNFSISLATKGNYKKEAVSLDGYVKMSYDDESMGINFDGTIDYTADVSIPELTSKNSVDVLNLSSKQQEEELNKLLKKASEVLPARLKLLGIDVKAEDIYKEKTTTTTTETPADTTTEKKTDDTAKTTTTDTNNVVVPNTDEIQKNIEDIQKTIEDTQKAIDNMPKNN
ncbi:MAG: hypothetical protein IKD76_07655 [Clostridia bacterium]|nr:hypothetical protein [Clostridia bacterium]